MKKIIIPLLISIKVFSQGTCASPDGPMLPVTSPPPDYNWLVTNGYCYTINPPQKTITMCFTFTSSGTNINVGYDYEAIGCNATNFSQDKLYDSNCKFLSNGTNFTGLVEGQNYTWCITGKCTGGGATGFDSFCPYWQDVSSLPVKLLSFTCIPSQSEVNITWITATEQDNDRFEVSRTTDLNSWEVIGIMKGNDKASVYRLTDYFPEKGTSYYRLTQIDRNGNRKEYSAIYCDYKGTPVLEEYYDLFGNRIYNPSGLYVRKTINGNKAQYAKIYKQ